MTTPERKTTYINIPNYQRIFADYQGTQPVEDGFANPVGKETI